MFTKNLALVWIGIIALSCMFLMGQEGWESQHKTVFVTDGSYEGNLGGLAEADEICQAEADAAGLAGEFKAWLSDSTEGPLSRFTHAEVPYRLVNGVVVAYGWDDLTDGEFSQHIDVTATGQVDVEQYVWTNTDTGGAPSNAYGDPSIDSCDNWTSRTASGIVGVTAIWHWTLHGTIGCYSPIRLYCMQQ